MRNILWTRDTYSDYVSAMAKFSRGMRRGKLDEARAWLSVAERCLRLQTRIDESRIAEDKRNAWRAEQPHHLKALEMRSRFPKGY